MKQIITYEFEESDFELLKQGLPDDPCSKCGTVYCPGGCPEQKEYDNVKKKFEDAHIYDVSVVLKEIIRLNKEKKDIQNKISELWKTLPNEIKNRDNLRILTKKV